MSELYIGLMSGTSIDSIDAGVFDLASSCQQVAIHSHPIPKAIREEILALCAEDCSQEVERLGVLDNQLGELFAQACNELLNKHSICPQTITAIGSHGQTIRHRPESTSAFSLQIGNANIIAERTGIDTIADFRRRDIALGGQGAPLVPAFHQCLFSSQQENRAIINIGGMANVTLLNRDGSVSGFDTGPGNVLMDAWIQVHLNKAYDDKGTWAASGKINHALLQEILNEPFFQLQGPKSTGRELFNLAWLNTKLSSLDISHKDVMATLLEVTAESIWRPLSDQSIDTLYLCGGGAENNTLVKRLEELSQRPVHNTTKLDLNPHWVEAAAFAWLAKRFIERKPGNLPSVTGASRPATLGCLYPSV